MTVQMCQQPLTGGDYFVLAIDHEMRRAGMHGNTCRAFVHLDGRAEAEGLRAAIRASGLADWLAGAHVGRAASAGEPVWQWSPDVGDVPIEECSVPADWGVGPDLPPLAPQEDLRPDVPPNVRFRLMHRPDGTSVLVLLWQHALMDAHGAELLLQHISAAGAGASPATRDVLGLGHAARADGAAAGPPTPGAAGAAWHHCMSFVGDVSRLPVASVTPCAPGGAGGRNRFRRIRFDRAESDAIRARIEGTGATVARSVFCMAVCMRALQGVLAERSVEPAAFLVPVPHERRKAGAAGPICSNLISFLFYRAEPADMVSLEGLIASLVRQMRSQVRAGIPASFEQAMEVFRRVPLGAYSRVVHGPSAGQVASFFFSDTGDSFRDAPRFLGARIRDVLHVPPVPFPPGVAIVAGQFGDRLSIVLSWVEGCLDSGEVDMLERAIRSQMLGGGAS